MITKSLFRRCIEFTFLLSIFATWICLVISLIYTYFLARATVFCKSQVNVRFHGYVLATYMNVTTFASGYYGLAKKRSDALSLCVSIACICLVLIVARICEGITSVTELTDIALKSCLSQRLLSQLEVKLNCCGITSYKDYSNDPAEVPISCCGLTEPCTIERLEKVLGCNEKLEDWRKPLKIFGNFQLFIQAAILMSISVLGTILMILTWHENRRSSFRPMQN